MFKKIIELAHQKDEKANLELLIINAKPFHSLIYDKAKYDDFNHLGDDDSDDEKGQETSL